jgi:hypothetical protein
MRVPDHSPISSGEVKNEWAKFHFPIRLHGVHRDFSFYTFHASNEARYRSVMNGTEDEARGFLLSASLFYPPPAPSGQILWAQTPVAIK